MARVYRIKKELSQCGIDENKIKEIIGNGDLINVIKRMEELLDPDIMRQVLDSCGCSGGKEYIKQCEKIGVELAEKSINEKISQINISSDSENIILNHDGTLTATLQFIGNEKYNCACSASVNKGVKVAELAWEESCDDRSMPLSYCLCCAGAFRRHLQLKLGVELKTKEIVSSPINSKGEKPCEFLFEIIG